MAAMRNKPKNKPKNKPENKPKNKPKGMSNVEPAADR